MRAFYRLFATVFTLALVCSGLVSMSAAEVEAATPAAAGFVSGPWRVVVLQTEVGKEIPAAKLESGGDGVWAVLVADVTNTGVAGPFDPASLQLGTTSDSPLAMTNGVAADSAASAGATQALSVPGAPDDGSFTGGENGTVRVALAFHLDSAVSDDESLVLRLNDQVMSVSNTVVDSLAIAGLPALVPEMQLQVADVTTAVGGGKINVTLRSGGDDSVSMDGVVSPKADADIKTSCYSGESSNQIMNLTGGTVWIEDVAETGESLIWFNEPSTGTFGLLNANLIAGGFAGFDGDTASPYASWLSSVEEYAKDQTTGLWSLCKSAEGAWIKQPAPTPIPTQSPEQVRAQYQWVDTRDLVIRPGEFEGDKIAVAGSVFNIMVDGNLTFIQMYVDGGNYDAVSIAFFGDSTGIYEDTWITVYGTGDGTFEGTNMMGGTISQPLIQADIIDH